LQVKLDRQWVDKQLKTLEKVLPLDSATSPFLFEPSPMLYQLFETGEDEDLKRAVGYVARHPTIALLASGRSPDALYLPPTTGQVGVAGRLVGSMPFGLKIEVSFQVMGVPAAVGTVVAHELGHYVLAFANHSLPNTPENELLTDLTSVFVGLGKLLLNGKQMTHSPHSPFRQHLGYLPLELTTYAYCEVCEARGVDLATATRNLTSDLVDGVQFRDLPQTSFET
jgi:hypothetical protein